MFYSEVLQTAQKYNTVSLNGYFCMWEEKNCLTVMGETLKKNGKIIGHALQECFESGIAEACSSLLVYF